jgi:AcrR family transcriptional regulator
MAVSLRERRRQMLRDEILLAAGALMNEKGYAAMSMDELASQVGISKPTLYSHFTTKEELVVAAVTYWFDRVSEVVAADTMPRTPLQQLAFIIRTVVQIQIDRGALSPRPWAPEVFQMLCQHAEVRERLGQIDSGIKRLVHEARASGEINPNLDPVVVVRVFFTLLHTLKAPLPFEIGQPELTAVADTLATIFERGVQARAPE